KTRTPRESAVLQQGVRLLDEYFEDVGREAAPATTLGGRPAQRALFQGTDRKSNAQVAGECVMTAYQGVGYWFVTWAPADQAAAAQPEFEALRQRLAVLDERRGWQEKRPKTVVYPGTHADYTLRDTEGLWKPQRPGDFDAKADRAFLAHGRDDPD